MRKGICESCEKKTEDLFCTPIGQHNWRCRDCQIKLCEAVYGNNPLEWCLDWSTKYPDSYPEMPIEYLNKRRIEIPVKGDFIKRKHWWNK